MSDLGNEFSAQRWSLMTMAGNSSLYLSETSADVPLTNLSVIPTQTSLKDFQTVKALKSYKPGPSTSVLDMDSGGDLGYICESEMNMDVIAPVKCPPLDYGNFRIQPKLFDDINSPYVKIRGFNDLVLDQDETNGILSVRMVAAGLSYMWRESGSADLVCIKLDLMEKQLTDISILRFYHHIVYLNLTTNNLTDLKVLSHMPNLQHLTVSHNQLTEFLDYDPPQDFLSVVQCSFNKLTKIGDLAKFWSIAHLDLSRNNIKFIKGLETLKYLRYLNLSHNHIAYVGNLQNLRIAKLDLSFNDIVWYDYSTNSGLCTLPYLEYVNLNDNKLTSLRIIAGCTAIQELHLKNNKISNFLEPSAYLNGLRSLRSLDLRGNPITEEKMYRILIFNLLPEIAFFDAKAVSAVEKVEAKMKLIPHMETTLRRRLLNMMYVEQLVLPCMNLIPPIDATGPLLIVLVGDEGVGKSNRLAEEMKGDVHHAINHTTNLWMDKHKKLTDKEFDEMLLRGELFSYVEDHGHYYGISRKELQPPNNEKVVIAAASLSLALPIMYRGYKAYYILCHGHPVEIAKRMRARYLAWKMVSKRANESMMRILLSDSMDDFFQDFPSIEEELLELDEDMSNYSLAEKKSKINALSMKVKNSLHTIYCKKLKHQQETEPFFDSDEESEDDEEYDDDDVPNLENLFTEQEEETGWNDSKTFAGNEVAGSSNNENVQHHHMTQLKKERIGSSLTDWK